MTLRGIAAAGALALAALSGLTALPASAFGPEHHYNRHSAVDPYDYHYEHRGYYPYYGSNYWRPARHVRRHRHRFSQPRYLRAWGLYRGHIHKHHHSHPHGTVGPHGHRHHHW